MSARETVSPNRKDGKSVRIATARKASANPGRKNARSRNHGKRINKSVKGVDVNNTYSSPAPVMEPMIMEA